MFEDFKLECIDELGVKVYQEIEFILELFESEPFEDLEKDDITVTCYTEKINQLQENVCVEIDKEDSFKIELLYENGINNGTQLNDYKINPSSSFMNATREYEIIEDIELDIEQLESWSVRTGRKYSIQKAQILLDNNRGDIMKLIKNQNYDNYVTGGGTNKTDDYYSKKKEELNMQGIFWKCKIKTETTTADFF